VRKDHLVWPTFSRIHSHFLTHSSQDASAEMLAAASKKHRVAKVAKDVTAGNITNSGVKGLLLKEFKPQVLDRPGKKFLSPRIKLV